MKECPPPSSPCTGASSLLQLLLALLATNGQRTGAGDRAGTRDLDKGLSSLFALSYHPPLESGLGWWSCFPWPALPVVLSCVV